MIKYLESQKLGYTHLSSTAFPPSASKARPKGGAGKTSWARLEVHRVFRPGGPSFHILGFVCVFICVWCSCKYFRSRMKIILGKYYFLWSIPLYCARWMLPIK